MILLYFALCTEQNSVKSFCVRDDFSYDTRESVPDNYMKGGGGMTDKWKLSLSGAAAGAVNGLFGGGGGMVLVPLLGRCGVEEKRAFATCVAVVLPLCILSAAIGLFHTQPDWQTVWPYLAGGLVGGWVGGKLMDRVSVVWLRRLFAVFLLYGGLRYLL